MKEGGDGESAGVEEGELSGSRLRLPSYSLHC